MLFALYSGVITPGEVGAAGALGALVLAALSRRMGMQAFFDSVGRAARGSAMVVLLVKTAEIGLISPPMGLNVFVVSGVTRIPVTEVFRGVWPFVLVELGLLGVLIAVPALSSALPALLS